MQNLFFLKKFSAQSIHVTEALPALYDNYSPKCDPIKQLNYKLGVGEWERKYTRAEQVYGPEFTSPFLTLKASEVLKIFPFLFYALNMC